MIEHCCMWNLISTWTYNIFFTNTYLHTLFNGCAQYGVVHIMYKVGLYIWFPVHGMYGKLLCMHPKSWGTQPIPEHLKVWFHASGKLERAGLGLCSIRKPLTNISRITSDTPNVPQGDKILIIDTTMDYRARGSWIGNACAALFLIYGVSACLWCKAGYVRHRKFSNVERSINQCTSAL